MGCSQSKIEIGVSGFRSTWDHGWVGFKLAWVGFKLAWVALAQRGPCVVIGGRRGSSVLVASHGLGSDRRGLKKLRMGFLGGLVLCNFVYFHNFWFNLSYVFCLVSFSLSFFSDEKV